jgi:hypothetical protein
LIMLDCKSDRVVDINPKESDYEFSQRDY